MTLYQYNIILLSSLLVKYLNFESHNFCSYMEDSDTMICHSTDNMNLIILLVMMKIKVNHVRLKYFVDIMTVKFIQ